MKGISDYTKEKRERKLLDTLNKVYDLTKDDYVSISFNDLRKMCDISATSVSILIKNFLYVKRGATKNKISNQYKWKSIKPNIHMARKLHKEFYEVIKEKNLKSIQNKLQQSEHNLFNQTKQEVPKNEVVKKEVVKKEIQKKEQKTKEVNLFWGLIKIKY